jgi:hypothetical protein
MKLSSDGNLIVTGAAGNPSQPAIEKLSKTNSTVWSKVIDVATLENAYLRATEVASDGHIYTAGDVWPGVNSRDIIVLKVNADGTTAAQALYDSQNHLADIPQSLAIDTQGNVYITGFSATPEGGTEFLTLKYSAGPTIAQKSDGGMHLEFHTNPGQQYSIEATTDFFNWQSLITNTADANGFVQFDDTNAPTIPFRLYRGHLNP